MKAVRVVLSPLYPLVGCSEAAQFSLYVYVVVVVVLKITEGYAIMYCSDVTNLCQLISWY